MVMVRLDKEETMLVVNTEYIEGYELEMLGVVKGWYSSVKERNS